MREILDLTGKTFGRLTVISFNKKEKRKIFWNCICDCGKEVIILRNNLKNGHTKSCGCYKKERTHEAKFKDLTGQKFGRLFVKEYKGSNKNSNSLFLCECDCGKKIIVSGSSLTTGNTKSCGCFQKEKAHEMGFKDFTGQKFGRLLVKEYKGTNTVRNSLFLCECECGKQTIVSGGRLTSGNTQSCGCLNKERIHEANFKDITGQKFGRLLVKEHRGYNRKRESLWLCSCDCGKEKIISGSHLISRDTLSCGCYHKERILECNSGANSPNWRGGISFEPYCPKFNNDLRRRIRFFFNNECILCGKNKIENKRELSCHHIEYNKKACCDGKPVHFAILCSSCHAKTNKDREQWEAMLHRIIDEIYGGKSYYTKEEILNGEFIK